MRNAIIIGTGSHVPEKIITNADLSEMLGEDINNFVENNLGILERHVMAADESTADLATPAAEQALRNAGITADQLELIILASDTPEYISPGTSVVVQHRLGAKNAGTFDINAACAGFVTAYDTAVKFIKADEQYKYILVIGAYAMSKFMDWTEKKTATIFADGAGAVVLKAEAETERGLLASKLEADGSYHNFLGILAGGTKMPVDAAMLDEGYYNKVRFATKYPPEVNLEGWPRIVGEILERAGLTLDDVNMFLWTQVNLSTIKEVMRRMDLPMERTHTIMQKYGYTGSACIPMVLHDAVEAGKIAKGDVVVMCASGGGLNMAAAILKF
jgi:3-oxoacyl-[acyl-carrier-protein] synthase-3